MTVAKHEFLLYQAHSTTRRPFEDLVHLHFPGDEDRIMFAYRQSKYGHKGQMRDGGDRYFEHPKSVALMLIEIGVRDADIIIAALLHDIDEDSFILTHADIRLVFGVRVLHLVKRMTKDEVRSKEQYWSDLLTDEDPGVQIEKCGDRTHNMSTLTDSDDPVKHAKKLKKKREQCEETREKVLPLAHKLAATPGYEHIGKWFVFQLTRWCEKREAEVAAG
jgi:GTP diphosphokinase / guanosine-3',5'-bis(diphosphate) 3'-diphosphatase